MDGEVIKAKFYPETHDSGHRDWAYIEVELFDEKSINSNRYEVYRLTTSDGKLASDDVYKALLEPKRFEYVICDRIIGQPIHVWPGKELLGFCSEDMAIKELKEWKSQGLIYDLVLVRWELIDECELSNPICIDVP